MIFITTGTQEPFDRLIKAIDEIAPEISNFRIVAQVTSTTYTAKNIKLVGFLDPQEFKVLFSQASLIISHAGMGTILSALENDKPIIVMPRLLKYREHRNEHQLATAKRLDSLRYVHVAYDENELKSKVLSIIKNNSLAPLHRVGTFASQNLTTSIKKYINS
jgi:UDP-N-acetylglucosamine transferase subunit ALG13